MKRLTITLTDEAFATAKQQADDVGWTPAQWVAWLVGDYMPPEEGEDE